jgi:hypothetical protein
MNLNRRSFLASLATAGAGMALFSPSIAAQPTLAKKLKLGFDNFSVRAMGWKAPALLDYAASLKLDSILISDLDAYDSLEDAHLKEVNSAARSPSLSRASRSVKMPTVLP